MADPGAFADFLTRIRRGDQEAATELVRRYEPLIRREVRLHLEDERLCRLLDSMDISQSVLGSFFIRAIGGEYKLDDPAQLAALLVRMTRNKLASAARLQSRQKRDHRRAENLPHLDSIVAPAPTPSRILSGKELLARLQEQLTAEEWQMVTLRQHGLAWADIAEQLGGTAQSRRMQLSRALTRVQQQLGLDDEDITALPS